MKIKTRESIFWGAAYVYSNMENKAVENLRKQGFNSFCPFFLVPITGTKKFRTQTLFPGYVFVEIDENRPWGPINSTIGVMRLLASDRGTAQRVPREFIESIQRVLVHNPDHKRLLIEEGTLVRLRRGSLTNQVALVKWSSEERLRLLFNLLGREVEVEVSAQDVEEV